MSARIKVSRAGIELIEAFEGLRRRAARLPDGRWTVGYGHTLSAREGAEVSEADARALLIFDLMPVADAVEEAATTPLTQNQFDALVAFAFNVGVEAFRGSAVLAYVNAGRLTEAALAMEAWRDARLEGRLVPLDPLIRRRAAEKALFLTPPGGAYAVPSALVRPEVDLRVEAAVPARGLADVEIPFDGPAAGVRVLKLPEPEPRPEPASPEPAPEPEIVEAAFEPIETPSPEPARAAEPEAELGEPTAPEPEPESAPPSPPRTVPEIAPIRAQLYAPYANMMAGPLPIGRYAPRPAAAAESAPAPEPAAAEPPQPEVRPELVAEPVVAAPLTLPPRPAEPPSFAPAPESEPQPSPYGPPPSPVFAPPAAPPAPPQAAEALVLTPPPERDPQPGFFGALRDPEPAAADEEPLLFEAENARVIRRETVAEPLDEEEPGGAGVWLLMGGVGIVAWAGAVAAFVRSADYAGRDGLLNPQALAWMLGVVGAACVATAAYFLLKRVGGVKD